MNFHNNHQLHFVITLFVMTFLSIGIFFYFSLIQVETQNTNRLSSARLIIQAIDNYYKNFQEYPENIEDIQDFLSPIPRDPKTKKLFLYTKNEEGFSLEIPQDKKDNIIFSK